MKYQVIALSLLLLYSSCTSSDEPIIDNPIEQQSDLFTIIGASEMDYGPHDLAINGDKLFACRGDKIYVFDLNSIENPQEIAKFDDLENTNTFEALEINGNTLYAGCTSSSGVYSIDISNPNSPKLLSKAIDNIYAGAKLKVFQLFYENDHLWAAGSNGLSATLVKYTVDKSQQFTIADYWVSSGSGNAAYGVWANSNYVFLSTADGHVYSFHSEDLSLSYIDDFSFISEAGHSHWGRSLIGKNNHLYWADWGAGFVDIDISNPSEMIANNIITNSIYTSQFNEAEGTDLYDLTINNRNGKIYVANGWSGLLEIDPINTSEVSHFVDYKENQYFCIEQYENYVILGDVATGTTDFSGIKIIKIEE